jgi:hypothetical protein
MDSSKRILLVPSVGSLFVILFIKSLGKKNNRIKDKWIRRPD